MPWLPFENAAQAAPGARMRKRKEFRIQQRGRPREWRVEARKSIPYRGPVILFTDGSSLRVAEAKHEFEVFVEGAD